MVQILEQELLDHLVVHNLFLWRSEGLTALDALFGPAPLSEGTVYVLQLSIPKYV